MSRCTFLQRLPDGAGEAVLNRHPARRFGAHRRRVDRRRRGQLRAGRRRLRGQHLPAEFARLQQLRVHIHVHAAHLYNLLDVTVVAV